MITTRKKKIPATEQVEQARRACGEVWTQLVDAYHYLYHEHDISLSEGEAQALFCTVGKRSWPTKKVSEVWDRLPVEVDPDVYDSNPFVPETARVVGVQQRQGVVRRFYSHLESFFSNLENWKQNGREGSPPKPPYRRKRYSRADWVHTRISKSEGTLELGTPRGQDPIQIDWPHPEPRAVQIIHEDGSPVICAQYDSEKQDLPDGLIRERMPQGDKVAGVDLGEKYLATAYDGEGSFVINGGKLRELRSLQNREKRRFDKRIDTKEEGSNRFWKLVRAKKERLSEIRNRIEDYLHKMSTRLVEELWARGVKTIVFGDISGIRDGLDYGKDMNRRLHQWAFGQFVEKVKQKAKRYGMTVRSEDEAFTSSTCPNCGAKSKMSNRRFCCSECGFEAHRDVVGAVAIRALFLHEETQDLEPSRSRVLKAVRATATESKDSRGSTSGRKTSEAEPDGSEGAAATTRATPHIDPPEIVTYHHHMDCVIADP